MPNRVRVLTVSDEDRVELRRRVRDRGAPARVVERARIVLLSTEGLTGPQVAARVGCTEPTVVLWRRRFAEGGLAGLEDRPRPGGPGIGTGDPIPIPGQHDPPPLDLPNHRLTAATVESPVR